MQTTYQVPANTIKAAQLAQAVQELATSDATGTTAQVFTAPTATPAGCYLLEKTSRSTDKNPIPQELRYRGAFIPEGLRLIPQGASSSKFAALLQSSIDDIAQARFAAMLKDDMQLRSIDPRAFSVDALLMYWAEKREAERITKESLLAWLEASKTYQGLSEGARKLWRSRLPGIIAPMYKKAFTVNEATSILAKLHDDDLSDPHAIMLANRLQILVQAGSIEDAF